MSPNFICLRSRIVELWFDVSPNSLSGLSAHLIARDAVSLLKLDIPMQGELFGSWDRCDLADRAGQYSARNILSM